MLDTDELLHEEKIANRLDVQRVVIITVVSFVVVVIGSLLVLMGGVAA